jgi:hypothetical protein
MSEDIGSPMDTASVWSAQDEKARRETSVSMDDPDVRLAAEALSGLGNPGTSTLQPLEYFMVGSSILIGARLRTVTNCALTHTLCAITYC